MATAIVCGKFEVSTRTCYSRSVCTGRRNGCLKFPICFYRQKFKIRLTWLTDAATEDEQYASCIELMRAPELTTLVMSIPFFASF